VHVYTVLRLTTFLSEKFKYLATDFITNVLEPLATATMSLTQMHQMY
jgi:hypothetical protein